MSDWTRIFTADNPVEAGFVRGLLESGGVATQVRNMELWTAAVEIYFAAGARPSVWVRNDQFEQARRILDEHERPITGKTWSCPGCGERLEAQFTTCWRCDTERRADD